MSKSMDKRLAIQRATPKPEPRFVQGFSDGSGMDCVRDTHAASGSTDPRLQGTTIAVTRWGCSCCEGEQTPETIAQARRITEALNFVRFVAEEFAIDGDVASLRERARIISL